jgi:pullulanase/glycogen debranching enzyme
VEGPTDDAAVLRLRARQTRNLAAALLLAHGVPMLHMGDEYGHTKHGNNNTYCHDGPLNWFDWDAATADAGGLRRFVTALIALRKAHPELRRTAYVHEGEMEWHGAVPGEPDWSPESRLVAASLRRHSDGGGLYVAFSSSHLPSTAGVPVWHGRRWVPVINTGNVSVETKGEGREAEGGRVPRFFFFLLRLTPFSPPSFSSARPL